MTNIILSSKKRNKSLLTFFEKEFPKVKWKLIDNRSEFTIEKLEKIKPNKIFIPHWSHIISKEIYESYECIVFHMTDLPYGRGGSPLQNLIVRDIENTKISALRVERGVDVGAIYLKRDLNLNGTAEEIFIRANSIIKEMIVAIIEQNIQPVKQEGETVLFKRRTPDMSDIKEVLTIRKLYDQIRMLDAEGYPRAFLETKHFRFEFDRASLKDNKTIVADVKIIQK